MGGAEQRVMRTTSWSRSRNPATGRVSWFDFVRGPSTSPRHTGPGTFLCTTISQAIAANSHTIADAIKNGCSPSYEQRIHSRHPQVGS